MTDIDVRASGPSRRELRTSGPASLSGDFSPDAPRIQPLRWPVSGRITPRSPQVTPVTPAFARRDGLDIEVSPGMAVVASGVGRVTRAEPYGEHGNCVDIAHGRGCVTRYAHLSKILTSVGATVSAGQKIGLAGGTVRSTAPHVTVGVYLDGANVMASRAATREGQWVSVGTTLPVEIPLLRRHAGRQTRHDEGRSSTRLDDEAANRTHQA